MGDREKRKVLLILPVELLKEADEAAQSLHISRLGFIRQAIARSVAIVRLNDKFW